MHRMSWFGCVLACTVVAAEATLADAQAGDGGCSPLSCHGYCGKQAPGGCYCDELCCQFAGCCADKWFVCGGCQLDAPFTFVGISVASNRLKDVGVTKPAALSRLLYRQSKLLRWLQSLCVPIMRLQVRSSKASGGCWCDECCCDMGDCCTDKFQICGGCNPTGRGDGPADINGDFAVNVIDLLAVINAWGPCTLPPAHDCADADIAPHPNGDRNVNVNDLLMVINNWG